MMTSMQALITALLITALLSPHMASATDGDPDAVDRARQVLEASAAAYKQMAAYRDVMRYEVRVPLAEPLRQEMEFGFGGEIHAFLQMEPAFMVVASSGRIFVLQSGVADKMVDAAMPGDFSSAVEKAFEGASSPLVPAQIVMREGGGVEAYLEALRFKVLGPLSLQGHRRVPDDGGGGWYDEITCVAENGGITARFDSRTHLLRGLTLEAVAPGAGDGGPITGQVWFAPEVLEEGAELVDFDPTGRQTVPRFVDLSGGGLEVGDPAPAFTLDSLSGDTVRLESLRGSVVVLDFWATWCAPCRMSLPMLQQFAEWAESSAQAIATFAVNTQESFGSADEARARISEYLADVGFDRSTLLDDGSVHLAFGGNLPRTVMIDPAGRVAWVHTGFEPELVAVLKAEAERALGGLE